MINFKKVVGSFSIVIGVLVLNSCSKCKECYFVELAGTPSETRYSLGEKCGSELEEAESTTFTAIDGDTRTECD